MFGWFSSKTLDAAGKFIKVLEDAQQVLLSVELRPGPDDEPFLAGGGPVVRLSCFPFDKQLAEDFSKFSFLSKTPPSKDEVGSFGAALKEEGYRGSFSPSTDIQHRTFRIGVVGTYKRSGEPFRGEHLAVFAEPVLGWEELYEPCWIVVPAEPGMVLHEELVLRRKGHGPRTIPKPRLGSPSSPLDR